MTLPSSGPISFSQINAELGRDSNAPYSLNENNIRKLASVGGTGVQLNTRTRVSFNDLKGHAWAVVTIAADTLNYTWTSPAPGKTYGNLIINAGIKIGSASPDYAALVVQGGGGDIVSIVNNGFILGAGGRGGASGGGGGYPGGDAMVLQGQGVFCDLQNANGLIGGGGGGGAGGPGAFDRQRTQPTYIAGASGGGGAGYIPGASGTAGGTYGGPTNGGDGQSGGGNGYQFNGGTAGYQGYHGGNYSQRGGTLGETVSGAGGRAIVNAARLVSSQIGGSTYGATV